jgi:hypothetical protein
VERILSAQARPKSILETLAAEEFDRIPPWLSEGPIAPRSTSVYQYLCESEPRNDGNTNAAKGDNDADKAATEDAADADGSVPEDP